MRSRYYYKCLMPTAPVCDCRRRNSIRHCAQFRVLLYMHMHIDVALVAAGFMRVSVRDCSRCFSMCVPCVGGSSWYYFCELTLFLWKHHLMVIRVTNHEKLVSFVSVHTTLNAIGVCIANEAFFLRSCAISKCCHTNSSCFNSWKS